MHISGDRRDAMQHEAGPMHATNNEEDANPVHGKGEARAKRSCITVCLVRCSTVRLGLAPWYAAVDANSAAAARQRLSSAAAMAAFQLWPASQSSCVVTSCLTGPHPAISKGMRQSLSM